MNRPVVLGDKLFDSKPSKRRERRTVVLRMAVNGDKTQLFEIKHITSDSPRFDANLVVLLEVAVVSVTVD